MKVNGLMIYKMELVRKLGRINQRIKGRTSRDKNTDRALMSGQMVVFTLEAG